MVPRAVKGGVARVMVSEVKSGLVKERRNWVGWRDWREMVVVGGNGEGAGG